MQESHVPNELEGGQSTLVWALSCAVSANSMDAPDSDGLALPLVCDVEVATPVPPGLSAAQLEVNFDQKLGLLAGVLFVLDAVATQLKPLALTLLPLTYAVELDHPVNEPHCAIFQYVPPTEGSLFCAFNCLKPTMAAMHLMVSDVDTVIGPVYCVEAMLGVDPSSV